MASLINRLDFWDKEENKRQREEEARRAAQAAAKPPQRNIASRAFDQVNPFDNNRTFKQAAPTQSKSAFQQAGQLGGQTARTTVGGLSRFANTAIAQVPQVTSTARMLAADVTGNREAWKNANQSALQADQRFKRGQGGILNTGTLYGAEDAKRGDLKTGIKRIGGGTVEAQLEAGTFGLGSFSGKQLVQQGLKQGLKRQLPTIAKNAALNTAQGGVAAMNQGASVRDIAKSAAIGGTLGTVADVGLGVGAAGIRKGVSNLPTPKPLNEAGFIQLPGRQKPFVINEGVPTVQPQKPLQIKAGVPLANNPLAPRKGLQIVDNNPQPFKIVDNSVPRKVSGAAQQSMLSKAKNAWNNRTPLNEGGYIQLPGKKPVGKLRDEMNAPDLESIIARRRELIDRNLASSNAIAQATAKYKGSMGIVPKEIMDSPEVKALRLKYETDKAELANFQKSYKNDKNVQKAFKNDTLSRQQNSPRRSQSPLAKSLNDFNGNPIKKGDTVEVETIMGTKKAKVVDVTDGRYPEVKYKLDEDLTVGMREPIKAGTTLKTRPEMVNQSPLTVEKKPTPFEKNLQDAGMSESEFFQRMNPNSPDATRALSQLSDAPDVPSVSPRRTPQEVLSQGQPKTPPLRSGKTDIESKMLAEAKKRGYTEKYTPDGQIANIVDELMKEQNTLRDVGIPLLDKYKAKMDGKTSIEKLMTTAERKAYKQAQQTSDNANNLLKEYFESKKAANTPAAPRRSQSPLRAGMSEDEFFQRFNPAVRDEVPSLSRSSDAPDVPSVSPKRLPQEALSQGQPQTPRLRTAQSDIEVPSANRTPRQLEIKESTAPFSNEQQKIVKDYADMLRYMGEGNGVDITPDGRRVSNNIRTADTQGQSRVDWQAEAERQLRSGKAEPEIQKAFQDLDDPEFRSLAQSAEGATAKGSVGDKFETDPLEGFRQKVQQRTSEKNIPVRKMTKDGDTVTATNVNPNIKAGEKRFALDADGNLIEDRKGAYRIFTDGEGRVEQVRIGKEVFSKKDFGDLSDVNDYGSTLATMRRNVERGFGKKTGEKLSKFLVDHQQAQATKMIERNLAMKEGLKSIADDLGINFAKNTKRAKEVSAAIQNYGEGSIGKAQLVDQFGAEIAEKIVKADAWFKGQYDTLLNEMNEILTKYGYDPVPKRNNYYTHFQDESMWQKFGLRMQEIRSLAGPTMQDAAPEAARGKISNALAGQSEFMTPNKRFNPFALQRKGNTYTPDAFQAFERYLDPTLNNIYMTPSITRARVVAKAIANDADILGKDANKIITQTREWANSLAGKSNQLDRWFADRKGGQLYLKAVQWVQKKAGQNTIVGNLSTAVMQPIVIAQTAGKFGYKNTILGAMQEMGSAHSKNAPIRQSQFMRRRYADLSRITDGKMDKARSVANKPLEVVEETSARITWNAAHNDALSKGLKGKEAIQYADVQAEKTLAGRSIGEKPEAFRSKAAGPLTMYQLEVNNYWQQFGKEMTKAQAAKTMVAAYGLNLLLQEVTGRQAGFNPIDAAIDSYKETQKEEKSAKDKGIAIAQRVGGEVVDNVPLVGPGINLLVGDNNMKKLLGKDSNTGRFGVGSPLSAISSTTNVGGIPIPQNLLLPAGGGQIKKTYEGAQALLKGGVDSKDGERQVDIPRTPENITKGLLFGKGAIPEVNAYYNNIGRKKPDQSVVPNQISSVAGGQGLDGLTKEQQEIMKYQVNPKDREKFLQSFREENKTGRQTDKEMETFKKSSGDSLKRSDGKYSKVIDGKVETFDSEADYKKKVAKKEADKKIEDFKNSKEKVKTIGDTVYQKKKNGDVFPKSKYEYEYDKKSSNRKLELDRAYEANNLEGYVKLAGEEYDALEKLKGQYDKDTEQDKIDALTLKQENLRDKVEGYLEKGYTKKGKGGGKGSKPSIDLIMKATTAVKTPPIRTSKMKVSAPRVPSMKSVKTPRVASKPRNRGSVTSQKVRIS